MKFIQIELRCEKEPTRHAKFLRLKPVESLKEGSDVTTEMLRQDLVTRAYANTLAALLDGSSEMYVHKPGALSPIGKCATCGGKVTSKVTEIEGRDDAKTS